MLSTTKLIATVSPAMILQFTDTFRGSIEVAEEVPALTKRYLTFHTRDEYLAWTLCWRGKVNECVHKVHQARLARRQGSDIDRSMAQSAREKYRVNLRSLAVIRTAAKVEAGIQRAASIASLNERAQVQLSA